MRKGEALLMLYSPEINSAAVQLGSNPCFEGSRRLLANLNVPEATIAEMERLRKVPASIVWSASRDGVVLARGAVESIRAAAGATLFRIGDISTIWVQAEVPEHDIGFIALGRPDGRRIQDPIDMALGGAAVTTTVEGRERCSVNIRYPRDLRSDSEAIARDDLDAGRRAWRPRLASSC